MSKSQHKVFIINVKGATKAVEGVDDMLNSVVEALQSQYPHLKIDATSQDLTENKAPFLMVPIQQAKIKK